MNNENFVNLTFNLNIICWMVGGIMMISFYSSLRSLTFTMWSTQISDANITITDPKPGAVETKIIISGTPEQTHAAQSLIQAFVMSERESGW